MLLVQVQQFWTGARYDHENLHQRNKWVKSRRFWGLTDTFVKVTWEKLFGEGGFLLSFWTENIQLTFTCSKSTIETLEKAVEQVQT